MHHRASVTGVARLGLVIPKRLARHAVTRNLIRRQAREAFRLSLGVLPARDIILRLTKSAKEVGFDRLLQRQKFRTDIESLLGLISARHVVELGNHAGS